MLRWRSPGRGLSAIRSNSAGRIAEGKAPSFNPTTQMMRKGRLRRLLIEEFEQIDADHDNVFNKQDLIRYLDRRSVAPV